MEDFALIFDVQRGRIIEISQGAVRQIKKGKNNQIPPEECGFWTRNAIVDRLSLDLWACSPYWSWKNPV